MRRIIYDAGALIAVERQATHMMRIHRQAMAWNSLPIVPTIVLGQVWRGRPRSAALNQALKVCRPEQLDVTLAKLGGQLCGVAGTRDLADAVVAVLALRYDAPIVTSDPDDLRRLTAAAGGKVEIFAV